MLEEKINAISQEALAAFNQASSSRDLYDLKVKYLGKQGQFSLLMREMGGLTPEQRPLFGKLVNEKKNQLEQAYTQREEALRDAELKEQLSKETVDLTLPGLKPALGAQHPIDSVIEQFIEIFSRIGYVVRTGPLIEKDWYNFEALNIPPHHPSRDLQDTFYIDDTHVLRTHTSPIQIRTLETEKPPLRFLAPGSVFRCDSDISHSPNFHQIEGMLVDREVSMADLKGTVAYFVKEFFGKDLKTRFRPSFFPFTEPSAEIDCQCPICRGKGCRMCKNSGWVEIGGCGLVHPKVLEACKVDPQEWQAFAFGLGVERLAIIKYGINDIRLFAENNLRFLEPFV